MKKLNLNAIRIDGGTQSRVEIHTEVASEYADAIKGGAEFPPVVVFHDGADYWLADGFHRYHAHKQAGKASISAEVKTGTQRDAVLYSLGANCAHGLRRSNADKRKAVAAMLADAEWSQWSDRKIAEACGVSHPFVSAMRKPKEVVTVTTPAPEKPSAAVESDSAPKAEKSAKRTLQRPESAPTASDELAEAQHTITDLAAENERLSDRLAVEAMDASEEEKTAAAHTIADLRERVRVLEIEVNALKASRDTYMRESAERLKQINYWRKQAEKASA